MRKRTMIKDYVEAKGASYIDTGFKPNHNTRVVMDVEFLSTEPNNSGFFGARTTANVNTYCFFWQKLNKIFLCDYGSTNNNRITIPNDNPTGMLHIDHDKNKLTLNGVEYLHNQDEFQCEYNMTLMVVNQMDKYQWFSYTKIHSCKIYDNGVLIRDYIPKCYNGKDGLYDIVGQKFYPLITDESLREPVRDLTA